MQRDRNHGGGGGGGPPRGAAAAAATTVLANYNPQQCAARLLAVLPTARAISAITTSHLHQGRGACDYFRTEGPSRRMTGPAAEEPVKSPEAEGAEADEASGGGTSRGH